jgi:cell shape-determining protein MreD
MLKKIFQYLFLAILGLVLVILQFSFISALPNPFFSINLLASAVILVFLISSKEKAWFLALVMGLFLDMFSFQVFGSSTLSLFLSAVLVYVVLENFLTNRSLYSFLFLTIIGILSETILYHLFLSIFDLSSQSSELFFLKASFWSSLVWSLLTGLAIVLISFHFLVALNRRLKPFFLNKT